MGKRQVARKVMPIINNLQDVRDRVRPGHSQEISSELLKYSYNRIDMLNSCRIITT
jgi:hypothetical protein